MTNLIDYQAHICQTAAGLLIYKKKVLFIKHKKLGIWFAPGGHIDEGELPHQAAEREFFEETGIEVEAYDPFMVDNPELFNSNESQYLPSPLETNLHWVSRENYQQRTQSSNPEKLCKTKLWPRGCEQHLGALYLVRPTGSLDFTQNKEETDGIDWFTLEEVGQLETTPDIISEVIHGLELSKY